MRVLVCGGRNYSNFQRVCEVLLEFKISLLIEGGANGADQLSKAYAHSNSIPVCEFPAPWRRWQHHAGPIRNAWMIEHGKPDLVIAFPGGKGTADMVKRAKAAKIPIKEVDKEEIASSPPSEVAS